MYHTKDCVATIEALEPRLMLSSVPYGAGEADTSEFMLGSVAVSVVLFESDGSIDPNSEDWTPAEIAKIKGELIEGAGWWEDTLANKFPAYAGDLTFEFDFTYADAPVQTGYEPITRTFADEQLWIMDFTSAVGYTEHDDALDNVRAWDNDLRISNETEWAFTVFMVDSSEDEDGQFDDGYFAWAYLGGPWMTMTYDNEAWTADRMDMVFAHETGHIFYALDEYPGSFDYFDHSGYYNTQNTNAYGAHPLPELRVASIMAEASKQLDAWAEHVSSPQSLAMLGWQDTDGDGIFDLLDVPHRLRGEGHHDPDTYVYTFTGSSEVQTLPNLNPYSVDQNAITLNEIGAIQYRIDSGVVLDTLTPTHTYTETGEYDVIMVTYDSDGNRHEETMMVTVVAPDNPIALPYTEVFSDSSTEFVATSGTWTVDNGFYYGTGDADVLSILPFGHNLPGEFTASATTTMWPGNAELNSFVIFDYISPRQFKFAGGSADNNTWIIGYRDDDGWHTSSMGQDTIQHLQAYVFTVTVVGHEVEFYVDGAMKVRHTFDNVATVGSVGLGSIRANTMFDNFAITTPPVDESPLTFVSGNWVDIDGVLTSSNTPDPTEPWNIALWNSDTPFRGGSVGASLTMLTGGEHLNAFIIFDYISPTDFKFAGMYGRQDRWVIGYRDSASWYGVSYAYQRSMTPGQDYNVEVVLSGDTARLYVDGVFKVQHTFNSSVVDGQIGMGSAKANGRFSGLYAEAPTIPTFPDLDGISFVSGDWSASEGVLTSSNTDDPATPWNIALFDRPFSGEPIGASLTAATGGEHLNAFIIFDYVSPTDFKFAGMYARQDRWVIGYRDSDSWYRVNSLYEQAMTSNQSYNAQVVLDGNTAILYVDGAIKVTHIFDSSVTEGRTGMGSAKADGVFSGFSAEAPAADGFLAYDVTATEFSAGLDQMVDAGQPVNFHGTVIGSGPYDILWDFGEQDPGGWITGQSYHQYVVPSIVWHIDTSLLSDGNHTIELRTIDTTSGVVSNTIADNILIVN